MRLKQNQIFQLLIFLSKICIEKNFFFLAQEMIKDFIFNVYKLFYAKFL